MNYCTLDEAWGNNILKESRKKKKTKRLYTSKIPPHVYDTSYEEGSHDPHCSSEPKKHFTVKNKNRFDKSRGAKDIFRPKRSSRVDDINLRYDEAQNEYKKYRKESKRNTRNQLSPEEIMNSEMTPMYSNNNSIDYLDGDEVTSYSPIQENDMELASIPEGSNMSDSYTLEDNDIIQRRMMDLQKEQGLVLEEQRQMVNQQLEERGKPQLEAFDDYYTNNQIEPFENNNDNLDLMTLEEDENEEETRISQINDIEVGPSDSGNMIDNIITRKDNNRKNSNNNNQKNNNQKNYNQKNKNVSSDEDSSDSEDESDSEELNVVDDNSGDLEYRLNNLNRNVNLIIKKMNSSHIFDSESEENIHDLILFVLFGIFIIFVLDTIYRFGRNSKSV